MKSRGRVCGALVAALALVGCGMVDGKVDRPRGQATRARSDLPVKIGRPYSVGGRTYVPADDRRYDESGIASWYGAEHAGKPTASGERFDPTAISAAHRTLPLPSYVEVTVLASGRRTVVRINDRGPFTKDRIIDLSLGAARLLGIDRGPPQRVRVRRIEPTAEQRSALLKGRPTRP